MSLDYFVLTETKLDESFPNAQFTLNGFEIRQQEGIEISSAESSVSMFEKVWFSRGLPNMSRNIVNVYVLKLLSLRKNGLFAVSIGPLMWKI